MFAVCTNGKYSPAADSAKIESVLAKALRLPPKQIQTLLSGQQKTLRNCRSREEAQRLLVLCGRLGVQAYISHDKPKRKTPSTPSTNEQIKAAFTGKIHPPKLEARLLQGLFKGILVATLPIGMYTALLLALLYLTLTHLSSLMDYALLAGILPGIFIYAVGAIVLSLALFHISKPLYAILRHQPNHVKASFVDQPHFLHLLNGITTQLNAPPITRIRFSDQVVIRLSYHRGWIPGITKAELELEIGLSLIYALSARELCALLSHHITRFSFGPLSRLIAIGYLAADLISFISRNQHVGNKALEEMIENTPRLMPAKNIYAFSSSICSGVIHAINAPLIGLSRHFLTSFELYCDLISARISGNIECHNAVQKLVLLQWAYYSCKSNTPKQWQAEHLPNNFPLWMAQCVERLTKSHHHQITEYYRVILHGHQCLFAPLKLRLRFLEKMRVTPVLRFNQPPAKLVNRIDKIAVEISLQRYRHYFGLPVRSVDLVSVDEALQI